MQQIVLILSQHWAEALQRILQNPSIFCIADSQITFTFRSKCRTRSKSDTGFQQCLFRESITIFHAINRKKTIKRGMRLREKHTRKSIKLFDQQIKRRFVTLQRRLDKSLPML